MQNNNNGRYCDRFNMTPQQFQNYKDNKTVRVVIYIIAMIGVTIFQDRIWGYVAFTFFLVSAIYNDYKKEEQWMKDGSMKPSDLN